MSDASHDHRSALELLDWKRHAFALYQEVRASGDPEHAWQRWRTGRDELFAKHPQSPIPAGERGDFEGLPYFDYRPQARVLAEVEGASRESYEIGTSGGGSYRFERVGIASFELGEDALRLELYWLEGYGGGLFLPFRDATSGERTYGAGRYLLDTVKGADLGTEGAALVLDFNFAYNPSCAYDPAWVCPLAPQPNWLRVPVEAGELSPE